MLSRITTAKSFLKIVHEIFIFIMQKQIKHVEYIIVYLHYLLNMQVQFYFMFSSFTNITKMYGLYSLYTL